MRRLPHFILPHRGNTSLSNAGRISLQIFPSRAALTAFAARACYNNGRICHFYAQTEKESKRKYAAMEAVKLRIKKLTEGALWRQVGKMLLAAGIGVLLSGVTFEADVSPFGVAFAAGAPMELLLPASLGAAAGAFVFSAPMVTLKYVGATTLIFLFRLALPRFFPKTQERYTLPTTAFFCTLLCAGIVSFASLPSADSLIFSLCEGAVAGASAAFWHRVFLLLPGGKKLLAATAGDTAALLFAGAMLLLAADRFAPGGVSVAHAAAFFLVMLLGLCAGETAGAVWGIAAGLTLGFRPEHAYLAFSLPAAGLLCGIAAPAGKLPIALAFPVCDLLFLVLKGDAEIFTPALVELAAATLLFCLLPKRLITAAEDCLRPLSRRLNGEEAGRLLGLHLRRGAKAVREISAAVTAVGNYFRKKQAQTPEALQKDVRAEVCADCEKRIFCWEHTRILTDRAFAEADKALQAHGKLIPELLPERLQVVCRAKNALCDCFSRKYLEQAARDSVRSEVYEAKAAAAAQFATVAALLENAAAGAERTTAPDPFLAAQAEAVFAEAGFALSSVLLPTDDAGRTTLELLCPKLPDAPDYNAILDALYMQTNILFQPPVAESIPEAGTWLTFCERTAFRTDFYKCSASSGDEALCGDACEGFYDGRGAFFCVLSDGMGTGAEAAVDAAMTCALTGKLLRARFSMGAAVDAVNAALRVNADDETLTTLDVLRLDLYTGEADLCKAGAYLSALRLGEKTAMVEKSTLPLGILGETRWERTGFRLAAGDAVIMMSDGADLLPAVFFKDLFYKNRGADAKTLATLTLEAAVKYAPIGRADDVTVACIRLINQ